MKESKHKTLTRSWFKRQQGEGEYHYYEVTGGPGKDGYQQVINFLNEAPIISIEYNESGSLTGTWCTYEVGESITEDEYRKAYHRALDHPDVLIF
jgi:hypothetical protein